MTVRPLDRGVSDEARYIDKATRDCQRHLRTSKVLRDADAVKDELATVYEECRVPNWDGFQAMPVVQDTLRNAYVLLESLPLGIPSPSIGAEPDGHLTLEWHRSANRTLSVSVDGEGNLHYAALIGPNQRFGKEAFFGESPNVILDLIRLIYAA
jgi:hypothetical protein